METKTDRNIEEIIEFIQKVIDQEHTDRIEQFLILYKSIPDKYKMLSEIFNAIGNTIDYKTDKQPGNIKTADRTLRDSAGDGTDFVILWGVLLKRLNIEYYFKAVSMVENKPFHHIYPVAKLRDRDVVLDSVFGKFDQEVKYVKQKVFQ